MTSGVVRDSLAILRIRGWFGVKDPRLFERGDVGWRNLRQRGIPRGPRVVRVYGPVRLRVRGRMAQRKGD